MSNRGQRMRWVTGLLLMPFCTYPNPEVRFPTQETVIPPMTAMSYKSRLIDIATSGKHHDVRVSQEEADRLIAWVDALCPYFGMEELFDQPERDAFFFDGQPHLSGRPNPIFRF